MDATPQLSNRFCYSVMRHSIFLRDTAVMRLLQAVDVVWEKKKEVMKISRPVGSMHRYFNANGYNTHLTILPCPLNNIPVGVYIIIDASFTRGGTIHSNYSFLINTVRWSSPAFTFLWTSRVVASSRPGMTWWKIRLPIHETSFQVICE